MVVNDYENDGGVRELKVNLFYKIKELKMIITVQDLDNRQHSLELYTARVRQLFRDFLFHKKY